jgi:hypothetical protein
MMTSFFAAIGVTVVTYFVIIGFWRHVTLIGKGFQQEEENRYE